MIVVWIVVVVDEGDVFHVQYHTPLADASTRHKSVSTGSLAEGALAERRSQLISAVGVSQPVRTPLGIHAKSFCPWSMRAFGQPHPAISCLWIHSYVCYSCALYIYFIFFIILRYSC